MTRFELTRRCFAVEGMASMWLKMEQVDDVTLLVPGRSLLGGPDMERLESALEDLVAAGQRKVILDLANVQILTSLALQGLLRLQTQALREQVTVCLCNADRLLQVPAQFWVTRLFTVYESRDVCLRTLAGQGPGRSEVSPPP